MSAEDVMSFMRRQLDAMMHRHRALVQRVKITNSDDTGKVRTLQVQGIADQVNSKVEHFEPFGFSANPPAGAEGIKVLIAGDPAHPVITVVFDRRYRVVNLAPGEAAMFNQWGDYAKFDKNRNITINAGANVNISAATKVTVTAPNAEFTGNLKVDGTLAVAKAATFSSGASVAMGNLTIGATAQVLVTTVGSLKIAGTPVSAP